MTEIKDKETGLTLAETIEKFREEVRKVDAENPDQRPAADMDWVAQTVTFPFELKNTLSDDEYAKFNEIADKAILSNFDPDVTKAAFEEAKELLPADESVTEHLASIFPLDEKKAEGMRNAIEHFNLAARIANKKRDEEQGN